MGFSSEFKTNITIFLETVGSIGLLFLINFIWVKNDLGFHQFNPNPYWLPVILIASIYGTWWGFFASFLTGVIYFFTSSAESASSSNILVVGSFFIISFILGQAHDYLKTERDKKEEKLKNNENEMKKLQESVEALNEVREELTGKLQNQTFTMTTMYETLKNLESLQPKEIYKICLQLLKDVVGVERASIYLFSLSISLSGPSAGSVTDNKLKLEAAVGYDNNTNPLEIIDTNQDIIKVVLKEKKVVDVRDMLEKDKEYKGIIMSAPIKRKTNEIIGVINVDKIPFRRFNSSAIKLFSIIADNISVSLDNALKYEELNKDVPYDSITKILKYEHVKAQLKKEVQLGKRYGSIFSILIVRINGFSEEGKEDILRALAKTFSVILRDVDVIGHWENGNTFIVILPFTDSDGALKVSEKLLDTFTRNKNKQNLVLKIGRSTFEPDMKSELLMLEEAVKCLNG